MSRAGKAWIRITVTGILFLLFLFDCALADDLVVTAACPSVCGETVTARKTKTSWNLSLPGSWDLTRIVLRIGNMEKVLLGPEKKEVILGQETDLSGLTGERISVRHPRNYEIGSLTLMQGSAIPSLFLEVDRNQLSKANINKTIQVSEGRAVWIEADGTVTYDGALDQLRARGNNSFLYSKKPYQFKLRDKAPLAGMRKARTWVLLSNWVDVSLLRNQVVMDLCRQAGLRNAVNCVQTDVWINGVYHGLYLTAEKVQIGKSRIDIVNLEKATEKVNADPFDPGKITEFTTNAGKLMRCYPAIADPEDITGGYIFTIEKRSRLNKKTSSGFRTENELNIRIKEPTCPSKAQAEYLCGVLTEMQKALISSDGVNHITGKTWEDYLDTTSFAQRYLVEEWTKNFDYLGGSQFMYKDSDLVDPKIYSGPAWDYDLCFGNMSKQGYHPGGAFVTVIQKNTNIWYLLSKQEAFRRMVNEMWKRDFRPAVAVLLGEKEPGPDSIIRSLDEYRNRISASVQMNTKRWGISKDASGDGSGGNFENAVNYMKQWIEKRTAWMDANYVP